MQVVFVYYYPHPLVTSKYSTIASTCLSVALWVLHAFHLRLVDNTSCMVIRGAPVIGLRKKFTIVAHYRTAQPPFVKHTLHTLLIY